MSGRTLQPSNSTSAYLMLLQAANLPLMFSLDTLMKMGSLPSLRLPDSGFPSLIAQRPYNGEPPNLQAFNAASKFSL